MNGCIFVASSAAIRSLFVALARARTGAPSCQISRCATGSTGRPGNWLLSVAADARRNSPEISIGT